ncbi:MAG: DUF2141 domain-containing protein [Halioglobus sp.]|nr:DUF2141 domain-containing protein [Halioglobus sp.]
MKSWSLKAVRAAVYLLVGLSSHVALAEEPAGTVTVEISGMASATGNVFIAVYDSDDTWLGDDVVMSKKVAIADALDGELVRTELQLPPGEYALSVFYDRDDDGELDTNFIGIPKEPVALSNNVVPKFGPPSYSDAVFSVGAEPVTQSIIMRDM